MGVLNLGWSHLLRQPVDPALPGGHHIDAKQYRQLISIVHYNPELLGLNNPLASASRVAGTISKCHHTWHQGS